MKKKSLRMVCLLLAGLMLLTTFGMLFSQLAMADETSSGGTGGGSSSGSLSMLKAPSFSEKKGDKWEPVSELFKQRTYKVYNMRIMDKSVRYKDFIQREEALAGLGVDLNNMNGYITMNGGNFATASDGEVKITFNDKVSKEMTVAVFDVEFYVEPDGEGRSMSLDFGYDYVGEAKIPETTPPTPPSTDKQYELLQSTSSMTMDIPQVYMRRVAIGGGGDDDSSSSSEDDDDSYRTPKPNIIITEYNYGGTDIMSGSDFSLSVKFQNTSKDLELENIIMQITPSTDLSIRNGSNSTFIEKLGIGKTHTQTLQMTSRNATVPEPQQITVKFTYEYVLDKQRKDGERTEVLAVPVVQLDRFSVGELSVPEQLWSNESAYLSIDYVNKGKTEVANVSARLESDIPGISESQTVGNIKAGDSGTVDFTFTAPASGSVSGKVVVTYENAKGQEITTERPFSTMVMDMGGGPNEDMGVDMPMPEPEDTGLSTPAKVMAVVGGLMVAALTGTVVVKKVKMKREEETDEDI